MNKVSLQTQFGYTIAIPKAKFNVNLYYMDYKDQLVKTGRVNNVGTAIMENVENSYRAGIELTAGMQISSKLNWQANATFSKNEIKDYTEYIDNWETWEQIKNYIGTTKISFSPEIIIGSKLIFSPLKDLKISFISKYVSEQYIDNSSSKDRMIDAYFVNNLQFNYSIKTKFAKGIDLQFAINNIFNHEYESNAWAYRYFNNNTYNTIFGYYPQAGVNLLGGVVLRF